MPGLAYYTETVTMEANSQTLTINHNLGTESVVVFINDIETPEFGVRNGVVSYAIIPPSMTSPLFQSGQYFTYECRVSSQTGGYYLSYANASSEFLTNSVKVYTRAVTYPFLSGRTYKIIVIALDVFSSSGVRYYFGSFELESTTASVYIDNGIGKTNVFGYIAHQNPVYYQNRVLACAVDKYLGNTNEIYPSEVRSSWNYVNMYPIPGGDITQSTLRFGVRNASYPFDTGTYKSFIIEIPE